MNLNVLFLVLVAAACAGAVATVHADASTKIMPLGDSITKGSVVTEEQARHPTYRYWLWNDLTKAGYDVDFVGSWRMPNFTTVTFDQDNEGHGGFTTDEILHGSGDRWEPGELSDWTQLYDYDMVLLLIGTNDVLHGVPTNQSAVNIGKIITVLRQKNPRVTIFLATLPPAGTYRQSLVDLNQEIMKIADLANTAQSRVILVDQYYGYNGVEDNQPPEYVHPDESGEKKIAQNWYEAITPILRAVPTPTPTTIPTTVPTTVPTPVPTTAVTPAVTASAISANVPVSTHAASGKHYAVGNPGSYLGGAFGSGGSPTSSTRSRAVERGQTLKPGSVAHGITPPTDRYVRWYPATRWAAGMR
ncbi:MAG: SGNH/GDSL hydrolase family protein [Methanospirillum sp.]